MMRPWFALFCLVLSFPATASANGAYTHIHISQLATGMLPPGELRALLSDPENVAAMEAGSMFPDSGYAAGDPYGELAHWEPFLSALIAHLRGRHAGDFSSLEAQREVAFLMGVASHSMADQSYDTTLLDRSYEVDGSENPDVPVDQYADYFLVVDQEVQIAVEPWAPFAEIVPAMASVGHTVSEGTLMNGMDQMSAVIDIQGNLRIAGNLYWDAWANYPFLGTHVYNAEAVGSVPWLGSLVAAYWEVLWARLHATDDVDAQLVIRTVPEDGGLNWPVDFEQSEAWGRPAIFFGYGIDRDALSPLVALREAASGADVPMSLRTAYAGRDRSLVFVRPEAALEYDTEYTIEIAPGVETLDGRTSTAPFLLSFRTRCAPDRLAECPELVPPLVSGPVPTRPPPSDAGPADAGVDAGGGGSTGGCAASRTSGRGRPFAPLLFFAAVLASRLRARRRR